eukprot:5856709-Pyramimonas_sp.AAC.1
MLAAIGGPPIDLHYGSAWRRKSRPAPGCRPGPRRGACFGSGNRSTASFDMAEGSAAKVFSPLIG